MIKRVKNVFFFVQFLAKRLSIIENTRLSVTKPVQYKFKLSKYSGNIKPVVENDLHHLVYDKCFHEGLQMS